MRMSEQNRAPAVVTMAPPFDTKALASTHPHVFTVLRWNAPDSLTLQSVRASPPGHHHGRRFLQDLIGLCVAHAVLLDLKVVPGLTIRRPQEAYALTVARMIAFYESLGLTAGSDRSLAAPMAYVPPTMRPDRVDSLVGWAPGTCLALRLGSQVLSPAPAVEMDEAPAP